MSEVFDDCDSLTPANGQWEVYSAKAVPEQGNNTLEVDTVDKVEGVGSLKGTFAATGDNWGGMFYKRPITGTWNFSKTPIMKFKIKLEKPFPEGANARFGIVTGPNWNTFSWSIFKNLPVGEWVTVEVDLRLPDEGEGYPDLTEVKQVSFGCWDVHFKEPFPIRWDFMELTIGSPIPLEVQVYPKSALILTNQQITLTSSARGGITPYTFEWFVNRVLRATSTPDFQFASDVAGIYNVLCKVIDSADNSATSEVAVRVKERATIKEPRMLHVEGTHLYNDLGERVHLHGVCFNNFTDSATGWFPYGDFYRWDEEAVKKNLEILSGWGCNCILALTYFDWLVNNKRDSTGGANTTDIGCLDAYKRLIELAYDYGIYVGVGIGTFYTMGGENLGTWVINNKSAFVEGWLKISRELRKYPNIIYGHPAEISLSEDEMNAYFDGVVEAVQAIRADGDNHIFLYHEDYCGYPVRFDKPATEGGEMIRKLHEYAPNIIYDGHIYRWHGTFGNNPDKFTGPGPGSNADGVYRYEDIKEALAYWGYRKILDEYKVPIIMWEGGPASAVREPNTWEKEITCYKNLLRILHEWDIGYGAFWWREPGTTGGVFLGLLQDDFVPNEWGETVIDAIAQFEGGPAPPTPISPLIALGAIVILGGLLYLAGGRG